MPSCIVYALLRKMASSRQPGSAGRSPAKRSSWHDRYVCWSAGASRAYARPTPATMAAISKPRPGTNAGGATAKSGGSVRMCVPRRMSRAAKTPRPLVGVSFTSQTSGARPSVPGKREHWGVSVE